MGNSAACCNSAASDLAATTQGDDLKAADATPILGGGVGTAGTGAPKKSHKFSVTLVKEEGMKLGLDVDYMAERRVLPVMQITGGVAEMWNKTAVEGSQIGRGDSIIEVNGIKDDIAAILEACKSEKKLEITFLRGLNFDALVEDLETLIKAKNCGPILIRLSWHDAGVYSAGDLTGGCPNAALRFKDSGEGAFAANAGLPTVALSLLEAIADKYVPYLLSNADLWTLAANVAIRIMGGPDIPVRFGRMDAKHAQEGVDTQVGRLPDGDKGVDHLRMIFHPKGLDDKAIVALSGAHTVGKCNLDRSGFDGAWTEDPLRFDNAYYKDLLKKSYAAETTSKGCPQHKHAASGTVMLPSDIALIEDPAMKTHVQRYADNETSWFADFSEAWIKLQENGCNNLREIL